jgi:hypothetical protein
MVVTYQAGRYVQIEYGELPKEVETFCDYDWKENNLVK